MAYKPPQTGYVLNDANYGTIFIGEDGKDEASKVNRKRQIEIHSQSDACIKLFKDGGFEIQSQTKGLNGPNKSDNIKSDAERLVVNGKDIHLSAEGTLTISAANIIFESTSSNKTLSIRANKDVEISGDNIKIDGSTVAIGAKTKMLLRSPGPIYINSNAGVSIVEPRISLTPSNLLQVVQTLATNIFGY